MKKRFLSLLLVFCMALSLLPTTAFATVGDLLGNTAEQNKSLLEQLESFTGESYEEAYELLSTLGLLDEDGSLITDRTIDLDGVEYTLEEIEALLNDPDTDLAQVATVDGVPIALGDLATIIAIERQLQYLQETYFTGRTFEGEALENLNSLMAQLQAEGLTLTASSAEDMPVFNTSNVQVDGNTYYISTQEVTIPAGTTLSVKFKMDFSDAFKALFTEGTSMFKSQLYVYLTDDASDRYSLGNSSYQAVSLSSTNDMTEVDGKEYTLTTNAFSQDYTGPLYLCITAPTARTFESYEQYFPFNVLTFGDIWQSVSFYDAQGFFFQNGTSGIPSDQWNGYFAVSNAQPDMSTTAYSATNLQSSFSLNEGQFYDFMTFKLIDASEDSAIAINNTLTYLQQCIDDLDADNAVRFHVAATLAQTNSGSYDLNVPLDVFLGENSSRVTIDESSIVGVPLTLKSGSGSQTIAFDGCVTNSSSGSYSVPSSLVTALCMSLNVTYEQVSGDNWTDYLYSVNEGSTTTTNITMTLVDDESAPTLTITAPAGTYQSGDVIPITITGDEFITATDDTQITVNGETYTLSDLHGSTSGKYISFLYEVKEIDNATLTVAVNSGITDFFGNQANEVNTTVSGVNITTPVLKNAVTGLTTSYDADTQQLSVGITVNQADAYQQMYSTYQNNKDGAMQLLISVDGGTAVAHTVTMGGSGNTYTFTADPYTIVPTAAEQAVTVQLQVSDGSGGWVTVSRLTQYVTIAQRVAVTGVTISVIGAGDDYNYEIALSDEDIPQLQAAVTPSDATYTSGTWHSTDETIATIDSTGQINLTGSAVGEVSFTYTADNGTPDDGSDDVTSDPLTFTVTAGDQLTLVFPDYAQDSLVREGNSATVKWNTNALVFYPGQTITFTVKLYKGDSTGGALVYTGTAEGVAQLEIPAQYLTAEYHQSQYTVEVSMTDPEPRSDTASITVLSPPTEMRLTADKTSITDGETLTLNCTISNTGATGALSAKRMMDGADTAVSANGCLSAASVSGGSATVTFTPEKVTSGLYDTYTITFTENGTTSDNFTPSSDAIVLTVYRSGALEIQSNGQDVETITLSNTSKVDGTSGDLPTDSAAIMALRQELGLIEYVSINADKYNWSSFSDGIQWVSDHPEAVGVYYRQGGLWDNIEDLTYETYLPQTQMAVSATADGTAVITATHAATGMSDSVTVDVETLRDKFYLFQVSPAAETTLTYTNGDGEEVTVTTNSEGVLALYEPSGIASDVYFRSGTDSDPYLGTILNSALSSGERDAAKLQLYPLNTITLRPAAKAELYLVKPDGTPYVGTVTLRGGVYLAGYYCEGVQMGSSQNSLIPGNTDGTYTTNQDGKLTVYMDATQFTSDEYTGQLTNADLDYWFELRNLDDNSYYPTLVNIQGSMSADYTLRTGSAVVTLQEVADGEENTPFVIAQTLSYGKDSGDDLQVRSVLGSTGKVGPNSTYKYTELTTRIMLWGVDNDAGTSTVTMTGENGFAPAAQSVDVNTFPFASIPIITNTLVLTKETMTESGWLKAETPATLRASVYQNGTLLRSVSMPFQVIDLTDVKLVDEDAQALVLDMTSNLQNGFGTTDGVFNFGNNTVSNAFGSKVAEVLNGVQENVNPLFRVLITPTEDSSVFNVLIWGGYDSLDIDDFDYSSSGLAMDYSLMQPELDVGVPPLNDLSDMAMGTYDAIGSINEVKYNRTNSGLDIGAQLTGYYEGQFYYDTDLHEWAFRTLGGGMTAGASVSFQANINAWAGPVPITATFAAGIALQLDFKAATVYTDQVSDTSGWTTEALTADSVNDYLTTLRIQGYIDAFGGLGFDYSVLALKIGLYGKLTADSTNTFLSRTYLQKDQQLNGQALGISGEVGIKFYAKFLFISYEAVIGSGSITYTETFNDYTYIDEYWNGSSSGTSTTSLSAAPTLLSRAYLAAYADGERTWNTATFNSTAAAVLSDANPGSEPAVNDDGSLSVYISDMDSTDYFDSRIMAGSVGTEGTVIDDNGFGDMSPSLSGSSSFSVATWVRLFEDLDKEDGEEISPAEQKQLLNSTEIMVATTTNGTDWTTTQLTDNAFPDLAPVTAANNNSAIVFWRSVYASDEDNLTSFDTQDTIYFSRYSNGSWSDAQMVYNGSLGSVVGIQTAMLHNGNSIVVFTVDRTGKADASGYEIAYRTVDSYGNLGDLVVLTSDSEIDTNPQVLAVSNNSSGLFLLGWYSTQDGGDIRLQAVGQSGQLYSGSSENAVPASVKAITGEDDLGISANFRFAKQYQPISISGITLVWPETVEENGVADHSVLYGTQLCEVDGTMYLSSPQALITLPDRTVANSFSAWQDSAGKVSAYIFGTWYDPDNTETISGIEVPLDTDKLLTGGGSMQTNSVSVDSIAVDYADLQTDSWTPVVFTLRNTGTTALTNVKVSVGSYSSTPVTLNPGESAAVTVMYKTGSAITNPTYTVSADYASSLVSDTLYLDYNDIGISSMQVVSEDAGKRTVQVTLYNDAAAKLENSDRTVELSFYTDSEHSAPANVTLVNNSQSGVSASGSTVTISGDDALRRMDQGSMTFQITYDLKDYVTNTLNQKEVPESGVYLYASAAVKDSNGKTMAEYATGNNDAAVQLTGALARTGKATDLDVSLTNSDVTTATVTLKNNSLQSQPDQGTLLAVLLDGDGKELETQVVTPDTALTCEETRSMNVQFSELGSDVVLLYSTATAATGLQELRFSNLTIGLSDFVLVEDQDDPNYGAYVYTLTDNAPASTVVAFISDKAVTVNGTEYDKAGSADISIPVGSSTITISTGEDTYILNLNRVSSGGGTSSFCTLTFQTSGGSAIASVTKSRGTKIDLNDYVPTREGYFFGGWYTESSLTNLVTSLTLNTSTTLYAKWVENPFTDVTLGQWFYDAVGYAYQNGLMLGTSDTTFMPDLTTTRGMVVTILYRLESCPAVTGANQFTDVEADSWYSDAVNWAAANDIVNGYGNGIFGPDDTITREQMAAIFYRYAQYKGCDVTASADLSGYTDADQISSWAAAALQWSNAVGLIEGTSATTLSPAASANRAQVATIMMRFCGKIAQ